MKQEADPENENVQMILQARIDVPRMVSIFIFSKNKVQTNENAPKNGILESFNVFGKKNF